MTHSLYYHSSYILWTVFIAVALLLTAIVLTTQPGEDYLSQLPSDGGSHLPSFCQNVPAKVDSFEERRVCCKCENNLSRWSFYCQERLPSQSSQTADACPLTTCRTDHRAFLSTSSNHVENCQLIYREHEMPPKFEEASSNGANTVEDHLQKHLRFRSVRGPVVKWLLEPPLPHDNPDFQFRNVYMSGSSQPSVSEWTLLFKYIANIEGKNKEKIDSNTVFFVNIFVDLRMESHGFVNGNPLYFRCNKSWALLDKNSPSSQHPEMDERTLLLQIQESPSIVVSSKAKKGPATDTRYITVNYTVSEYFFVKSLFCPHCCYIDCTMPMGTPFPPYDRHVHKECPFLGSYVRWRIPDHNAPSPGILDSLVILVHSFGYYKTANESSHHNEKVVVPHFHFHCSAGKGRTSFFMIALDILIHAGRPLDIPLDVIMLRQLYLNDYDIADISGEKLYKKDHLAKRLSVLESFYDYVSSANPLSLPQLTPDLLFSSYIGKTNKK